MIVVEVLFLNMGDTARVLNLYTVCRLFGVRETRHKIVIAPRNGYIAKNLMSPDFPQIQASEAHAKPRHVRARCAVPLRN